MEHLPVSLSGPKSDIYFTDKYFSISTLQDEIQGISVKAFGEWDLLYLEYLETLPSMKGFGWTLFGYLLIMINAQNGVTRPHWTVVESMLKVHFLKGASQTFKFTIELWILPHIQRLRKAYHIRDILYSISIYRSVSIKRLIMGWLFKKTFSAWDQQSNPSGMQRFTLTEILKIPSQRHFWKLRKSFWTTLKSMCKSCNRTTQGEVTLSWVCVRGVKLQSGIANILTGTAVISTRYTHNTKATHPT